MSLGSDGTSADFHCDEWRVSRKEHRCSGCDETIRKGDTYHHCKGLWDGYFAEYKHCGRCWAMLEHLFARAARGDGVDLGLDCGHTWDENFGAPPPEWIASLAFMSPEEIRELARKKVQYGVA